MYSIIILLTVLGVTKEVPLRDYYEKPTECRKMIEALIPVMEPREGVTARIRCVSGWKIKY